MYIYIYSGVFLLYTRGYYFKVCND